VIPLLAISPIESHPFFGAAYVADQPTLQNTVEVKDDIVMFVPELLDESTYLPDGPQKAKRTEDTLFPSISLENDDLVDFGLMSQDIPCLEGSYYIPDSAQPDDQYPLDTLRRRSVRRYHIPFMGIMGGIWTPPLSSHYPPSY
jgi:hypothetical protein